MFDYPGSRNEITAWTIALHLLLLVAASIPIFILFWKSRKNAQLSDLILLGLVSLVAFFVLLMFVTSDTSSSRPFVVGYILYFELITIATMFVVARRMARQGKSPSVGYVLASLFAFGFLIAVLLPSVPSAREAARRMQCANNLKNIMVGIHAHADLHDYILPPPILSTETGAKISWRVELLPFIESKNLYAQYDRISQWDAPTNLLLAKATMPPTYRCPSNIWDKDERGCFLSAYAMVLGSWAVDASGATKGLRVANHQHHRSLMIVEACGQNIVWTEPRDVLLNNETAGVNLSGELRRTSAGILSSHHQGGAQAACVDGSVQLISNDIDREVLRQLCIGEGQSLGSNR